MRAVLLEMAAHCLPLSIWSLEEFKIINGGSGQWLAAKRVSAVEMFGSLGTVGTEYKRQRLRWKHLEESFGSPLFPQKAGWLLEFCNDFPG